jgi:hypothetical protein
MTTLKDSFNIDIVLRHPSYSPEDISKALSIEPQSSWAAGQSLGTLRAQGTFFHACLRRGDRSSDYEAALAGVVLFLDRNAAFLTDFISGHGEVELILNHTVSPQEEEGDRCFESYLDPAFLGHLSRLGIGLRVQGSTGKAKGKEFALPPGRASLA